MEKINRFRYENLVNEVHVQFHEDVTILTNRYNAEEMELEPLYGEYTKLFEAEKSRLDIIFKSGLTAELEEQDHVRNNLFRGFADTVKGNLNNFEESKRQAAGKLQIILNHYGNIAAKTANAETAAIEDLYRELQEPGNLAHITALNLGDWLTRLLSENCLYEQMYMARFTETAKRPKGNMKEARTAVDKIFRTLLDKLDSLIMINSDEKYAGYVAELNAISNKFAHILALQKGARAAKKEKEAAKAADNQ